MSKLIVTASNKEQFLKLVKMDIDGIIVSVKDLAVNDSWYMDIDSILKLDFNGKEGFININKLMHEDDLGLVYDVLKKLRDMPYKIMFYDMGVYNIAKELGMVDKLVICQDHLNLSTYSNKFYQELGINTSFISNDITREELLRLRKNLDIKMMFLVYGYQPIFYSRRYLVSNYLDYIKDKKKDKKYEIISDDGHVYPIVEEEYGTTIYTDKAINLVNYMDILKDIDYLVIKANMVTDNEFIRVVEEFINKEKVDNPYIGFFETKTIYRVK